MYQACESHNICANPHEAFAHIYGAEYLKIMIFIQSCIFFALLTFNLLVYHAIYYNQVMFCWFESTFVGVVSNFKYEI